MYFMNKMTKIKLLTLGLTIGIALAVPLQPKAPICGYESCPKPVPGKINVHLVPHTHDDVGWLKTVDQYYYGSKNNIQNAGVQYILDSVIGALLKNPERKFIWVESAFFFQWWVEQTPELQQIVKDLVNAGQLEFIGGAWSMNDEATVHYQTTIDQFTYGLRKLNDTFGYCGRPKIGWQIDPFGHSREQASLMAQFDFDGFFFARLDYQDKNNRVNTKTMEMIWETSSSLGDKTDMFTHALYAHYSTPGGFCWDSLCSDEPLIDNPKSPDYNIPNRVDAFIETVTNQAQRYASDNIIVLFGDDFQYKAAHMNFINIDKLIRYVNARQANGSNVNVFYSTPSCYVKSVNEANLTWTTKQDDFFPYASAVNTYWTGYFTSRPTLKYFERLGNNILQVAKQLSAVTDVDNSNLEDMQAAMGILQHHDAITGTEKQAVAEDYARILDRATVSTEELIESALNKILKSKNGSAPNLEIDTCRLRNISECVVTSESDTFLVTVYNPLSRPVDYFVRLPVHNATYRVQAPNGDIIPTQLLPIPEQLANIPGRRATTDVELVFNAVQLPALGYRSYYVTKVNGRKGSDHSSKIWKPAKEEQVTIGDERKTVTFEARTHLLKEISDRDSTYDISQSLQFYISENGQNGEGSGAYIFRPTTTSPYPISDEADLKVVEGGIVSEVQQVFSNWATQVVRYYANQSSVEIEWLVGPIPVDDNQSKEIISKFTTSISTSGTFFTDSNGREVLKRQKDYRPTWNLEINEPVSGNYYPIVSHIGIDNGTAGLAIVTDRAQGGSSLSEGSLELMIHRRLLHQDGFGEALNETAYGQGLVARGKHYILIGDSATTVSGKEIRQLELKTLLDGLLLVSDVSGLTQQTLAENYVLEYSTLKTALLDNVQVLTLEPWKDGALLLRLENIYSVDEDPRTATVDLTNLFSPFTITSARETNLAANQYSEDSNRLQWHKDSNAVPNGALKSNKALDLAAVELAPREIKTFVLEIA